MSASAFSHRLATPADIPALTALMNVAIVELLKPRLTLAQVAASFEIMGLDTELIADGTYFVVECDGAIAGSGGWSRRATHFGGDHSPGRDGRLLDRATEAARVRAMYTHPGFARRGVGRLILDLSERAATREGFARVELVATMAGLPLYRSCGYEDVEAFEQATKSGVAVPLMRMSKALATSTPRMRPDGLPSACIPILLQIEGDSGRGRGWRDSGKRIDAVEMTELD
jgi:GNAT superfamily N-acetyltransferase